MAKNNLKINPQDKQRVLKSVGYGLCGTVAGSLIGVPALGCVTGVAIANKDKFKCKKTNR